MHLGTVAFDRIGCDRARKLARHLEREFCKQAFDESRTIRITRTGRVYSILDRNRGDLYLLFARDDAGTLFAERHDERLHMLQYLPLRQSGFLQNKPDLIVITYQSLRPAQASA